MQDVNVEDFHASAASTRVAQLCVDDTSAAVFLADQTWNQAQETEQTNFHTKFNIK